LNTRGVRLRLRGVVQGVGMRPTVWRLARQLGLRGSVRNAGDGVLIEAWGEPGALDALRAALRREAPPLARIDAIEVEPLGSVQPPAAFSIEASTAGGEHLFVAPDTAPCAACLAEIRAPGDRRAGYAFTNCTHCGPRLSILRALPYDRANTSMDAFTLCADCKREYEDPADRRFHAQPNACPRCGPRLWLEQGGARVEVADPIAATAALLRQGRIVAIKGVGGFHLAVDATNAAAVDELRRRKRRPHKPLALLARDLDVVRRYRAVNVAATAALESAARPIVLLEDGAGEALAAALAPGSAALGFMLPMSPLHQLLMEGFAQPLVFTSGNAAGDPQCTGNAEARARLGAIADAMLMHDRDIVNRLDDAVLRPIGAQPRVLRRGRGQAPRALELAPGLGAGRSVVALGAELKSAFCLLRDGRALLSQHLGDLENAAVHAEFETALKLDLQLFAHRPDLLAIDAHPDYLSSKFGRDWAAREGIELVEVQHHHAHIAACLAEHGQPADAAPVLGLALDGLGWGADATLWGGELLLADYRGAQRLARLQPIALPGGAVAARQPWRNLAAQLLALPQGGALRARYAAQLQRLEALPIATLERMIRSGFNSPVASSCGRLFDAVAAALGLCFDAQSYEGQAALELEQLARRGRDDGAYAFEAVPVGDLTELRATPLWPALFDDLQRGVAPADIARRFHAGLARAWIARIDAAALRLGCTRAVLSGGVLQNRLLAEALQQGLERLGLEVLTHSVVPCNDGGLALGQAVVAVATRP
jgi:hydrogenase maturation protein HypF